MLEARESLPRVSKKWPHHHILPGHDMGMNKTERQILTRLVPTDSLADLCLNTDDALALVKWAQANSLMIVGIDGFHQEAKGLRPDLSLIADFSATFDEPDSWDKRVTVSCAGAYKFVETHGAADVRFNFVFAEQSEDR